MFFRLQCHIVVDDFGVRGNRPREDNRKVAVITRVRNIITQVVKTDGRIKVNDFVFYLLPFPLLSLWLTWSVWRRPVSVVSLRVKQSPIVQTRDVCYFSSVRSFILRLLILFLFIIFVFPPPSMADCRMLVPTNTTPVATLYVMMRVGTYAGLWRTERRPSATSVPHREIIIDRVNIPGAKGLSRLPQRQIGGARGYHGQGI